MSSSSLLLRRHTKGKKNYNKTCKTRRVQSLVSKNKTPSLRGWLRDHKTRHRTPLPITRGTRKGVSCLPRSSRIVSKGRVVARALVATNSQSCSSQSSTFFAGPAFGVTPPAKKVTPRGESPQAVPPSGAGGGPPPPVSPTVGRADGGGRAAGAAKIAVCS